MRPPEPRLWQNGVILGPSIAEALYAEEGRVLAVGSISEVLRSVPTGAERVDLGGRCVIPGLVDCHLHVAASVRAEASVDLSGARTVPELLGTIELYLAHHPGPVLGGGWDQERLEERRMPSRTDLDRLPTDQPVILYRRCGHVAVLNSAALDAAGLRDATPDPPDGTFGRSEGSLDGRLFDGAMAVLPALEDRWFPLEPHAVRRWFEEEASVGVTALGAMSAEPEELRSLGDALGVGLPIVKVGAYLRASWLGEFAALRRELDGASLRVNGAKVMSDGSLGARTAWLSEPYEDATGTSGTSLLGPGELEQVLREAAKLGAATAIHAIGDRAFRGVLDAIERVPDRGVVRIEHASLALPELIERAATLRLPIAVQPSFVPSDRWIPDRLGASRGRWAYPFQSMLERGIRLGGSSDAPIESRDPWEGIAAAISPEAGRSENLTAQQALELYTSGSSYLMGEDGGGTLAPGTPADLVVLRAPRWPEAALLGRSQVEATYLGGGATFVSSGFRASQGL